jgi:hypothetical protein
MDESFFICSGSLVLAFLLFGFIVVMRFIAFRETMSLAEKGLVKPERRNGNGALVWGIMITAVGLALCIGLFPLGWWIGGIGGFPAFVGPWLLPGLVPVFFGLGLILIHVLTHEPKEKPVAAPPAPEPRFAPPPPPPPVQPVEPPSTGTAL